ncbi:hypothetical protein F4825DRAFT_471192 [Nemania diffusa]|nr:hypothetical protein F4825DRAFT_471192 [Nemania diffusa]
MSSSVHLCRVTHEYGMGHLWGTFESRLSELFIKDIGGSTVGVVRGRRDEVQWVSATAELCTIMREGSSTLLILKRYNSWSRISVTVEFFDTICRLARITPYFLHFIVGMGTKFSSKDEDFMSCYSTCASSGQNDSSKSALHHSFTDGSSQSIWVVVQPPEVFNLTIGHSFHPMALHLRYLHAAIANWREYLDFFSQRFTLLNQQIAIPSLYHKLKITSSHQQLHHLKGKLHHARTIFMNTRATINIIATFENSIAQEKRALPDIHDEFQLKLNNISREVDNYILTTDKLLRISDDLKSMYSDILALQGQELQRETSFKDSRSMRIATAIAMFYLPVNLVFSFFSTTLVWYGTTAEVAENNGSKIQLRSEVWIASATAVLLAISTVSWAWWWNCTEEKKGRVQVRCGFNSATYATVVNVPYPIKSHLDRVQVHVKGYLSA